MHAKLSSLDHQHTNNDQLGLNLGLLFFSTSSYNFKEPDSFNSHSAAWLGYSVLYHISDFFSLW